MMIWSVEYADFTKNYNCIFTEINIAFICIFKIFLNILQEVVRSPNTIVQQRSWNLNVAAFSYKAQLLEISIIEYSDQRLN